MPPSAYFSTYLCASTIAASQLTADLAGKIESGLKDDVSIPSGAVVGVSGNAEYIETYTEAFNRPSIRGRVTALPATESSWQATGSGATSAKFHVDRIGPNVPMSLVELRKDIVTSVFLVCGIPREFSSAAEGSASREALRRLLHLTIQPIGDSLAVEASRKLGVECSFDFDRLFASDISGRARAFQSMVGGGMDIQKAAQLAGLMETE